MQDLIAASGPGDNRLLHCKQRSKMCQEVVNELANVTICADDDCINTTLKEFPLYTRDVTSSGDISSNSNKHTGPCPPRTHQHTHARNHARAHIYVQPICYHFLSGNRLITMYYILLAARLTHY